MRCQLDWAFMIWVVLFGVRNRSNILSLSADRPPTNLRIRTFSNYETYYLGNVLVEKIRIKINTNVENTNQDNYYLGNSLIKRSTIQSTDWLGQLLRIITTQEGTNQETYWIGQLLIRKTTNRENYWLGEIRIKKLTK